MPPDITLNTFIREHVQLTATKYMCLEGGCGVCVCVIKGKQPSSGVTRTWAANTVSGPLITINFFNKKINYYYLSLKVFDSTKYMYGLGDYNS